jgi:hypothetical protein
MRFTLKLAQSTQPGERHPKFLNATTKNLVWGHFLGKNALNVDFKPKLAVE